ncbi:MAG: carboxymuconolactone decarboxylase family protein [Magnetococcus sp. MYC-9]
MRFIDTLQGRPYAWYIRPVLLLLGRAAGGLTEPVRLWGRVPLAFLGFLWMLRVLDRRRSGLTPALRALVRTRVAQLDLCGFCIDLNGSIALQRGVTEEKLLALADFASSPLYDAAETAALAFTETVTLTGRTVEAPLMERLKSHFSDDAIIELTAIIAHQNLSTRFNRALGVHG